MPSKGASPKGEPVGDDRLVVLLAQGLSQRAVARIAGVDRKLVGRRMADPEFAARVVDACVEASREAGRLLARRRLRAARVLCDLMGAGKPDAIRLAAAKVVLEAGLQAVEMEEFRRQLAELKRDRQGNPATGGQA